MNRCILLLCLITSTFLLAEEKKSKQEIKAEHLRKAPLKSRVWTFELALLNYVQESSTEQAVEGKGARVSVGYGMVSETRLMLADFNLYLGPFGSHYHQMKYDQLGSGVSVLVGSSLGNLHIRGSGTGLGILGGFSYHEFRGRTYGRNDADDPVPATQDGIVTAYASRGVSIDLNAGFFVSWMKDQRPDTTYVESLVTRNEGYILSLQGAIPVWSQFRSQYTVRDASGAENDSIQRGGLSGFKLILSLRTFLGS